MDEKTTINDVLVYAYCGFCFLWSIYVIFFAGL